MNHRFRAKISNSTLIFHFLHKKLRLGQTNWLCNNSEHPNFSIYANAMSKKPPRPIPHFKTPIIETHCHLDYLDADTLEETIETAVNAGVKTMITIAVSPDNQQSVLDLVDRSNHVWGTQGIHPHEAKHWNTDIEATIRTGAAHPRIVAIGEIGLDYHYNHADRQAQIKAFEAQLMLAIKLRLPVVIHTREADDDTHAILSNASGQLVRKGVIHSFTSSLKLAEYCLSDGFYLGFNGIITFKNADNVRKVATATPLEQLLLETDAPYLTPEPYRGQINSPKYLPFIAEKIAEVKQVDIETLLQHNQHNSQTLFFSQS